MKIPFIYQDFLHIKVFETPVTPNFCPKVELPAQNCMSNYGKSTVISIIEKGFRKVC